VERPVGFATKRPESDGTENEGTWPPCPAAGVGHQAVALAAPGAVEAVMAVRLAFHLAPVQESAVAIVGRARGLARSIGDRTNDAAAAAVCVSALPLYVWVATQYAGSPPDCGERTIIAEYAAGRDA
jgi:hypothetical protein